MPHIPSLYNVGCGKCVSFMLLLFSGTLVMAAQFKKKIEAKTSLWCSKSIVCPLTLLIAFQNRAYFNQMSFESIQHMHESSVIRWETDKDSH